SVFVTRKLVQFILFELVLILLMPNALQPAMAGPDNSVTGGVIIIVMLLLLNRGVDMARSRFPAFDRLVEPPATPIIEDGKWIATALEKEGHIQDDAMLPHREHGLGRAE